MVNKLQGSIGDNEEVRLSRRHVTVNVLCRCRGRDRGIEDVRCEMMTNS